MDQRPVHQWQSKDGRVFHLSSISPADAPHAAALIRRLSFASRYFRFGHGDFALTEDALHSFYAQAREQHVHFIVLTGAPGAEIAVACAQYVVEKDKESCEFALVVADEWQGRGLGNRVMDYLLEHARQSGLRQMVGHVLATNFRMFEFARRCGFRLVEPHPHRGVKRIVRAL